MNIDLKTVFNEPISMNQIFDEPDFWWSLNRLYNEHSSMNWNFYWRSNVQNTSPIVVRPSFAQNLHTYSTKML
jgi:hypothetical protein